MVRSLGEAGYCPEVAAAVPSPLAARSRWTCATHRLPSPRHHRDAFCDAVWARVRVGGYALVMPLTDWSLVPLVAIRERLQPHTHLAAPAAAVLDRALSKWQTLQAGRRANMAIPSTTYLQSGSEALPPDGPPYVVKSDRSKGWRKDRGWDAPVTYASTASDARAQVEALLPHGPALVQSLVPGEAAAQAVLCQRGAVLTRFQYRRLHEVPISGGASSYRVSEAPDPALSQAVDRLMAALDWTGVAMVETKRRANGQYVLLEVNGRFWGSVALPYHAGMPFAAWAADLYLDHRTDFPAAYPVGLRARAIAPDIEWLKQALLRSGAGPQTHFPTYPAVARDLLRWPLDRLDCGSLSDPKPLLSHAARLLVSEAHHAFTHVRRRRIRRQMEALRQNPQAVDAALAQADTIGFVCHGNIIRSPYAGATLRALLPNDPLHVQSTGLWAIPKTPAHRHALAAQPALGHHTARLLSAEDVAQADLLFVMGIGDRLTIERRFGRKDGVWLLGALLGSEEPLEIPDPMGHPREVFEATFQTIDRALARIVSARER